MKCKRTPSCKVVSGYLALVKQHPLRSIRTPEALIEAEQFLKTIEGRTDEGSETYKKALQALMDVFHEIKHD